MPAINKRLQNIFLKPYKNGAYLIKLKADALMYFNLFFITVMLALAAGFTAVPPGAINKQVGYIIITITTATCFFDLQLLKKGQYHFAANLLISVIALLTGGGLISKIYLNPAAGQITYVYLMFPGIIAAGLFCSRRWLGGVALYYIACETVFFFATIKTLTFTARSQLKAAFIICLFALLMSYIITYLIVTIGERAIHRSDRLASDLKDLADSLEIKVQDRTAELERAMNAIWGEMELAKKIQTVLLPETPYIEGFEISAHMKPADEVGGDYYDIINVEGRDWLVIGDVSGHGVPAGLVMMMVQTSIRMVLNQTPACSPSELLTLVNKTISSNIKKLNEDKYMTITVLACREEGAVFFSGLHQDIMIYRSNDSTVELIETDGIWLGIMDDIDGILKDNYVTINRDDMMLLYTDGITEAWQKGSIENERNFYSEMFGEEQLRNILRENGKKSPEEVKDIIISRLEEYELKDDVTLLIVKRVK